MDVNNIQFTKIEIQIAKYLFKHYKDRYNPRQLARILDINHAHANKLCSLLTEKRLLIREEIGNSVFYTYNYSNRMAIKFIEYMLSVEEFPKWLAVLLHSLKRFNDCAELCLIFGSSVKDKSFNDIDILLMYAPEKAKEIRKIKDEIRRSGLIEEPIRYVDVAEKDILQKKEDKIMYSIMSENLIVHNPEKYVEIVKKCRK